MQTSLECHWPDPSEYYTNSLCRGFVINRLNVVASSTLLQQGKHDSNVCDLLLGVPIVK